MSLNIELSHILSLGAVLISLLAFLQRTSETERKLHEQQRKEHVDLTERVIRLEEFRETLRGVIRLTVAPLVKARNREDDNEI